MLQFDEKGAKSFAVQEKVVIFAGRNDKRLSYAETYIPLLCLCAFSDDAVGCGCSKGQSPKPYGC
jgi:hypothetical protein